MTNARLVARPSADTQSCVALSSSIMYAGCSDALSGFRTIIAPCAIPTRSSALFAGTLAVVAVVAVAVVAHGNAEVADAGASDFLHDRRHRQAVKRITALFCMAQDKLKPCPPT